LVAVAPLWAADTRDTAAMTADIDRYFAKRWTEDKVQPAAAASDAEFIRRVYLDLTGKVPPLDDVRVFLDDSRPDKRQRLVERLLGGSGYAMHFANVWRAAWLPENNANPNGGLRASFETWLRARLAENARYDKMAREILTVAGAARPEEADLALGGGRPGVLSPAAFLLANENKPENLAGSTARLFLAVKLECAQCHDHPHAAWTREQFWQYAAFFGELQRGRGGRTIVI